MTDSSVPPPADDEPRADDVAHALIGLLEEPFATCEDVGLDVRRVERTAATFCAPLPPLANVPVAELVVELADGSRFQLAVARTG